MAGPTQTVLDRIEGRAFNGTVSLRDFDAGIVLTLGAINATIEQPPTDRPDSVSDPISGYFLPIEGVDYPPNCPGIPILFSYPEDRFGKYRKSSIMVRRDDISPSMYRWHPGTIQSVFPAKGALEETVEIPPSGSVTGYNKTQVLSQAVPYDISYTIQITAPYRADANRILDHILRIYGPYSCVVVMDSVGDRRLYSSFMEGTSIIDDSPEVANRIIGFTITLRVEAELDQTEMNQYDTVTSLPVLTFKDI